MFMMSFKKSELRKGIPTGKTRVIGVDLFSHEDYLIKDCDSPAEAFELADRKNLARTGKLDDTAIVYDDTGKYLRGHEAVSKLGISP